MNLLMATKGIFNRHLAHLTALVGIPLAAFAAVLLVAVDLQIVRNSRSRLFVVGSAAAVMIISVGFMFYRFGALKS